MPETTWAMVASAPCPNFIKIILDFSGGGLFKTISWHPIRMNGMKFNQTESRLRSTV